MSAHHGVGADDNVVLDGGATQDGGAPADEHVVPDGHGLFIAKNLPGLALHNRPAIVVRKNRDGSGKVHVVANGQKVRIGDVHTSVFGAVKRNVLPNRYPLRPQVLQVTLVVHQKPVINVPNGILYSHKRTSKLENSTHGGGIQKPRRLMFQQSHEPPLRKPKLAARILVDHLQQALVTRHLAYSRNGIAATLSANAGHLLPNAHLHVNEQRLAQT